jgi:hypothetical protein
MNGPQSGLEPQTEPVFDRRPLLAMCACQPEAVGWDMVEDLSGRLWSPQGARTCVIESGESALVARRLERQAADPACRGILLTARTEASVFQLQMRAENRALDDPRRRHDRLGPGVLRATAPVGEILKAMREAQLATEALSTGPGDLGDHLFYRALNAAPEGPDWPAVTLLRAPAHVSESEMRKAIKIVLEVMAQRLAPLPRPEPGWTALQ